MSSASPALTGVLFTTVCVIYTVCVYIYICTHSCHFILLVYFKLISLAKGRFIFTSGLLYQYLSLIIACVPQTSEDQLTVQCLSNWLKKRLWVLSYHSTRFPHRNYYCLSSFSDVLTLIINTHCLPGGASHKNPQANTGDITDVGWIPGSVRSLGGAHGNPLQYSCLEESHAQGSLAGYSPWSRKELDTTEQLNCNNNINTLSHSRIEMRAGFDSNVVLTWLTFCCSQWCHFLLVVTHVGGTQIPLCSAACHLLWAIATTKISTLSHQVLPLRVASGNMDSQEFLFS